MPLLLNVKFNLYCKTWTHIGMGKKQKRLSDYDSSGRFGVTEMFGAIIFMLIGGFRRKYDYYYQVKYQKRNIWTGYLAGVVLVIVVIITAILYIEV